MNGNPYTTPFIGSTGLYPINELIKSNSNISYTFTSNTSNYSSNSSNYNFKLTSNLSFQLFNLNQYTNSYPIIYKDTTNSTILKITGVDTTSEIKFDTMAGNQVITKIDNTGKLKIYHPADITLPNRSEGWWYIHDELAQRERDTIGLRFDLTQEQALSSLNSTTIANQGAQINTLQLGLAGLTAATIPSITGTIAGLSTSKQDKITAINPLNLNTTNNNLSLNYDVNDFVLSNGNLRVNSQNIFINSNIFTKQYIPNFWTSSNVGIGTTNPLLNIHIHNPSLNSVNGIQITDGNTTGATNRGFSLYKSPNNDSFIYNNENANLILGNNQLERMRIDTNGNVNFTNEILLKNLNISNIFTTSNISSNNIYTNSNTCYSQSSNNAFTNSYNYTNSKIGGTNPWTTSGTNIYNNNNTGNVGINNTNPQFALDVNYVIRVYNTAGAGYTQIHSGGTGNTCGFIAFFTTAGTRRGYIGWIGNDNNYLILESETANGCLGYQMNGNLKVDGYAFIGSLSINTTTNPDTSIMVKGYRTIKSYNDVSGMSSYMGFVNSADNKTCYIGIDGGGLCDFERGALLLGTWTNNSIIFVAGNGTEKMRLSYGGNLGIQNNAPIAYLSVGNASVSGSIGTISIARNDSTNGNNRQFVIHYNGGFYMALGDYGNLNTVSGPIDQFLVAYNSPLTSVIVSSTGNMNIIGSLTQNSDETIKTDITTIENALWKVQQLRGVEYTHIIEGTKNIGLIAQEVENVIPEAVFIGDMNGLKSVAYANLVSVLIEAIKELNMKVDNMETILKNNNLI